MAEVGSLTVPVRADLGPLNADLEKLRKQLGQTDSQTQNVQRSMQGVQRQTNGLTAALRPLAAALAGVFSVRALIQFTDTWTDLTSRVNLAAGSIETGTAVMDQLQVIARRTYSSLQQTTEGYIRNAQTLRDLGRSTQDTLNYTEALNNALVVSGARADRAARVQEALGRGLAAGALRGQELNTVIESGGRVAELLAEELGTTVSGLRALGQQGKITGDVIDRALVGNLEKLREEADSMPATIGDAFQLIANALLQTIGVFDTANEISGTLAESLIFIADNMERVVTYVAVATGGWLAYATAVTAVNAGLFTTAGALLAVRRAFMALGIGLLVVGISELIIFINRLVTATGGWGEALDLLKDVASDVWDGIGISAQAIPIALEAVWTDVRAGFAGMIGGLQRDWAAFLQNISYGLSNVPGFMDTARDLFTESGRIDAAGISNQLSVTRLREEAEALREEAAALATEGLDVASESLQRLLDLADEAGKGIDLSGDGGENRVIPTDTEAQKLADKYRDILSGAREFIAAQELERQAIGLTDVEANKLRYTFDLLNEAQRAGITITPQVTEELTNLAHQMAEVEEATNRLREAYDFAKDTFKGFFTDLKRELQNGASVWEAFGTAAANALQKIADRALDLALNGIFDMIFGAFTSGGGNFLSGILGFENGTSFAPGGVAVVGERGPELVRLPGGSQVIPNNRVIVPSQASFGGGGSFGTSRVALDVFVKDDGKIGAIARQEAGAVVETTIRDYDTNQLPDSVQRISTHPRMRHAPA